MFKPTLAVVNIPGVEWESPKEGFSSPYHRPSRFLILVFQGNKIPVFQRRKVLIFQGSKAGDSEKEAGEHLR